MSDVEVCANCNERPAIGVWIGDGCALCATRHGLGLAPRWCDRCMAVEQLKHARKMVAQIPDLERRAGVGVAESAE